MIQQQTYVDNRQTTQGAKQRLIKVCVAASSMEIQRKGRGWRHHHLRGEKSLRRRDQAGRDHPLRDRRQAATRRDDGSYVRFEPQRRPWVIDKEKSARTRIFGAVARELTRQEFHEDRLAGQRSGLTAAFFVGRFFVGLRQGRMQWLDTVNAEIK